MFVRLINCQLGNLVAVFDLFCCSVAKLYLTLCYPMECSTPGFLVLYYLPEFAKTHVYESMIPSTHLILCCPLLFLPSIFPTIRVFSNDSALCSGWPKYWSFSISPSNGHSGLISLRIDWFDLLVESKGLSRVFSSTTV